MSILSTKTRSLISSAIAGLLVTSFIFAPIAQNSSHGLKIQTVEAIPVFDAANFKVNLGDWIAGLGDLAVDTITAESSLSLELKEFILDFSAWTIVNLVLQEMIRSVTAWVASGFQGSPAFITDLQGFLLDIADQVAGDFIYGSSLQALCSPFKLNIQIALELQYSKTRKYKAKCRLSSVVNNIENFMNGDFLSGGWDGWFNMALTPGNNQYGALMEAQFAMDASIVNAKGQQIKLLDFGRGLFSKKDANGKIVTPGAVIETQLNKTLGLTGDRLVIADEINELIGALFSQLVSTVLTGAKGLAGLNDTSSGPSYFDQIKEETSQQGAEGSDTIFKRDIAILEKTISLQNSILSQTSYAESYMSNQYPTCSSSVGALTPSLASQKAGATASLASANSVLTNVYVYKSDNDTLGNETATPAVKNALMAKYGATSASEAQLKLITTYTSYAKASVPSPNTNASQEVSLTLYLPKEIAQFTQKVDSACKYSNNP